MMIKVVAAVATGRGEQSVDSELDWDDYVLRAAREVTQDSV